MLKLLLIIPLIGCLPLILIPEGGKRENKSLLKSIALTTSLITLFISIVIWIQFDSFTLEYQYVEEFHILNQYHFNIGLDGISLYFVLLTTFITPICLLSNWTDITKKIKYFLIFFLLLESLQIAVFVVLDLLLFYVFFESVLIPLFLIIGIWGASANRIRAAFLLFLYTLGGSLFMLWAILWIYYNIGVTNFNYLGLFYLSVDAQE